MVEPNTLSRRQRECQVVFNSDSAEELTIYYVGIHFDWMDSDAFTGPDLSDNPVTISGYGSHTFDPIAILIPEDASVGTHNYFCLLYTSPSPRDRS